MKTVLNNNEYPSDGYNRRFSLRTEDLERIIEELREIVKREDWQEAGPSFILNNCIGDILWGLGIGFFWIFADEYAKSKGSYLTKDEFQEVAHTMGISKSFAYDCKRAASAVQSMMKEPEIWQVFRRDFSSKTAIYRLSRLKESLKKYLRSDKTDADKEKLFGAMKRAHSLPRDEFYRKGKRYTIKGRITQLQDNQITIAVSGVCNFEKDQDRVIGSSASVRFKVEERRNNNPLQKEGGDFRMTSMTMNSDRGSKKTERSGVSNSILTRAVVWLVGFIKVILNMAS